MLDVMYATFERSPDEEPTVMYVEEELGPVFDERIKPKETLQDPTHSENPDDEQTVITVAPSSWPAFREGDEPDEDEEDEDSEFGAYVILDGDEEGE